MSKRYSIAAARDAFMRVVHEAESGQAVELTRRGKAVAVIVSVEEYRRSREDFPSLWAECRKFRDANDVESLGVSPDVFEGTRDTSSGRKVRL